MAALFSESMLFVVLRLVASENVVKPASELETALD